MRYTALQKAPKDDETIITQYSAKPLEDLGLIKMDFLGYPSLGHLYRSLKLIEERHHKRIDPVRIPLNPLWPEADLIPAVAVRARGLNGAQRSASTAATTPMRARDRPPPSGAASPLDRPKPSIASVR